ncbi:MAG: hypothetical protein IJ945_04760 [Oscillospiraceae bacterium]|nr:hypothetical protein [Oscillospiraceae bacterium]
MKKIILITVLILSLCGCSKNALPSAQEVAKAYQGDFSAAAKVEFRDGEAEMEIAKNPMSISISLSFPAEISGMGIEIFDEHAKITYEGMEQEIRKENLPEGTPFLLAEELFEELSDPEDFTLSTENGNITASGDDFSAVLSAEDFSVISAVFPEYGVSFAFSDFEFSGGK